MTPRSIISGLAGVLLPVVSALAAESVVTSRPFAAPTVPASAPAGTAGGIAQVTFALLLVLVAVFVVAVLVKRFRNFTGGSSAGIEVLAQTALGQRERAVIVRVGEARLLLGVTPGQVTLLHSLPPEAQLQGSDPAGNGLSTTRPTFANLLRKSLGR